MNARLIVSLVAAAVVVGVTPVAVATAALQPLHLTATVTAKHHGSGGSYSSRETVYQGKTKLGEDTSTCVLHGKSFECRGSYTLHAGDIDFRGTIRAGANSNTLTITSGTGRYKDVHGRVETVYNRQGTKATETITFS